MEKRAGGGFRPGEDAIQPAIPAGVVFTKAAEAGGTDRDVLMGYQMFLGRDPESSFVIADAKTSPVGAFLRALMGSGEFQSAVLDKLAAGRKMPHEAVSAAPSGEQMAWLFNLVHVPGRPGAVLRAATSWAEWMRTLVAIPGLPTAPPRAEPGSGPQAQDAGEGFVLVTIEQPKPGERLRPGALVHGSGWAIAPADVAEVAVHLDGRLLTHARYGLPRPDVARSFPHYRHVDHCGFTFAAEVPEDAALASLLTVSVRSADGQTGSKGVRLQGQDAAPPRPGSAGAAETAWPIRLAVEEAVVDEARMLRVRGWAVSAEPMQAVSVAVGQAVLGDARHGLPRPDIAGGQPGYANAGQSGFALVCQLPAGVPAGPGFVRVQAADCAGHTRQTIVPVDVPQDPTQHVPKSSPMLGVPPAAAAAPRRAQATAADGAAPGGIACACERATLQADGALRVDGWALAPHGITGLRVELDGISLGQAALGRPSPSLAAARPDVKLAGQAGFTFSHILPRRPAPGVHHLSLHVTAEGGLARVVETALVADAAAPAPAAAMQEPAPAAPPRPATGPVARPAPPGMRLEVDRPAIFEGAARGPVRGALTIAGWSAARGGIAQVDVFCDERLLGHAHLGMRREDIGAAFPDYKGALLAGYALVLPPGTLPEGNHEVRVVATPAREDPAAPPAGTLERRFRLQVERYDALPPDGSIRLALPPSEAEFGLTLLARLGCHPQFTVVLADAAAGDAGLAALAATLRSLSSQAYGEWSVQARLPDAASLEAARALPEVADPAGRVRLARQDQPAAGTAALPTLVDADPAAPAFTLLLRAGDLLGADALLELACALAADRHADFIYADELRADPGQGRRQPFFKPDWSPDLLLAMNYVGRPWCAAAGLLERAGLDLATLAAGSDYAAVLALSEHAARIVHVPRVLCDRQAADDTPAQEQAALAQALARRGDAGAAEPAATPGTWRVRRPIARRTPPAIRRPRNTVAGRVSIIIPTCAAGGLVRSAIKSIRATSAPALAGGREVEIVILDNTPVRETRTRAWLRSQADVVIDMPGAFNWSRFNNLGARAATGEFLLFLNDDVETRQPDWLEAMLEHAQRPEVGVVGARLLYPDGTVQHGGQYLADSHARHAFRFAAASMPGPFGLAGVAREVVSVTGACQMVRARTFAQLGGFDEAHSVVNNDLDFCLRAWQAGLRVVFTPHASLTHHELASRAALQDSYDEARFATAWRNRFLAGDPYRSPRLAQDADHYGADPEPTVLVHAGRRGPAPETVRRILAVKLDHIGDFLTALPALRSLRRRFPAARIDLLAPAASAELAAGEPAIDETIVFDFFHARSGLGQKGVGEAEFEALRARLAPARYDMAIDLRMQPETRAVLPYTGAAFLVGYDHANRFAFLDVALEWEGDERLALKRAHVSERLVELVSAAEDACRAEPVPPAPSRLQPRDVPALAALPAAFLACRLVCIHPGVGNVVRQWPASSYAALVDLLAGAGLHAVLVGAPEEAPVAEEVLRQVAAKGAAESLVGRVKLAQLAQVMRACALFVGNNSGPQHLAAAQGTPTIGIHSGVVDATEWAPLGTQAVAMRRRMICAPCYLEFASDCPRDMACLTGLRPRDVFAACLRMLGQE